MLISSPPTLAIVVPCYNEEAILPKTNSGLISLLAEMIEGGKIQAGSFIFYVDDGSRDRTWPMIEEIASVNPQVRGLKLSRNFGHQNALLAGMLQLTTDIDCLVTIDADLQDDPRCIIQMVDRFREGYSIVYGVRVGRDTDTFIKRWTAQLFYRLINCMGVESIYNHADFRLVGRNVLNELAKYGEVNMFLRGIFPQIGFRSAIVSYDRQLRTAGRTKFSLSKMLAFAWDGITSFSTLPLRMIFLLGCTILVMSMLLTVWALIPWLQGRAIHGWASTVIPIFIFSGLQMISVGILGEYLAKIYQEVKSRPRFIVETDTRKQ